MDGISTEWGQELFTGEHLKSTCNLWKMPIPDSPAESDFRAVGRLKPLQDSLWQAEQLDSMVVAKQAGDSQHAPAFITGEVRGSLYAPRSQW